MARLRIGFSGTGWIADWHLNALKNRKDARVIGACGAPGRFDKCKKRCESWGIKPYRDFEELVSDPSIDALYILSPTDRHYTQTMQAIKAGKHVLVEKPVALDAEEISAMKKASVQKGVMVFPAHNFVYRPVVRAARKFIDSDELGAISHASFRAVHFIPEELAGGWRSSFTASGGGAMIDSGTHLVYQSLYLMGMPARLSAFSAKKHYTQLEAEDICQISVQYRNGAIGSIMQSWAANDGSSGEIRIQGDKANLLISDALYLNGKKVADDADYGKSFEHTAAAFLESASRGTRPLSGLDDAATTLKIIQAAYASAKKGEVSRLS